VTNACGRTIDRSRPFRVDNSGHDFPTALDLRHDPADFIDASFGPIAIMQKHLHPLHATSETGKGIPKPDINVIGEVMRNLGSA
jgi:hypothetical protein